MRPDKKKQSFAQALVCATKGIQYGVCHERNMQIDGVIAVFALVLGGVFQISLEQWLFVIVCIVAVLACELINTALEALTDLASPEFHPLAARVKDCAAGACLIISFGSLLVGIVIFLPKIAQLLF